MILAATMILALQQWSVGPRAALVVDAGDGVGRECWQQDYAFGLGGSVSRTIGKALTLEATGRGHWLTVGSVSCFIDPVPPPTNGVYTESDRVNLLAIPFFTSDVRVKHVFGQDVAALAIGGGNAWRDGHNFLYALVAGSAGWHSPAHVSWGFDIEYQLLRVTWAEVRRTYQNGSVVAEQQLGEFHQLSHALLVGFHVQSPL